MGFGRIGMFVDIPSMVIVIGGAMGALMGMLVMLLTMARFEAC